MNWELIDVCLEVLNTVENAGIPGLKREKLGNGRPSLAFEGTTWGDVKVLLAAGRRPALRDCWERNGSMKKDPRAAALWESFRQALGRLKEADTKKAHVYLPVRALRGDGCRGLIQALREFRNALGTGSTV